MCCDKLPPPSKLNGEKVEKLMCSSSRRFDSFPPETQKLKDCFIACSSKDEDPVIVFVSKMFPVSKSAQQVVSYQFIYLRLIIELFLYHVLTG